MQPQDPSKGVCGIRDHDWRISDIDSELADSRNDRPEGDTRSMLNRKIPRAALQLSEFNCGYPDAAIMVDTSVAETIERYRQSREKDISQAGLLGSPPRSFQSSRSAPARETTPEPVTDSALFGLEWHPSSAGDSPPKSSQWSDGDLVLERRLKEKTRGVPYQHLDIQQLQHQFTPSPATAEVFAFTNAKQYEICRALFPYANDEQHPSGLRWNSFVNLLVSHPLLCTVRPGNSVAWSITRPARNGMPKKSATIHQPHGKNPWLERHMLVNIAGVLEHKFGWTRENFILDDRLVGEGKLAARNQFEARLLE